MDIFIRKDVFDDIQAFKTIVYHVLEGEELFNISVSRNDNKTFFYFSENCNYDFNEENYYRLKIRDLENNLMFTIEIEKGNYPD